MKKSLKKSTAKQTEQIRTKKSLFRLPLCPKDDSKQMENATVKSNSTLGKYQPCNSNPNSNDLALPQLFSTLKLAEKLKETCKILEDDKKPTFSGTKRTNFAAEQPIFRQLQSVAPPEPEEVDMAEGPLRGRPGPSLPKDPEPLLDDFYVPTLDTRFLPEFSPPRMKRMKVRGNARGLPRWSVSSDDSLP